MPRYVALCSTLALSALLLCSGCQVSFGDPNDGGSGSDTTILIRFINSSDVGVDPEFYINETAVSRDALFADENKFTAFGDFNLGLIGAGDMATVTINCADARVLGIRGAKFGNDQTSPIATGRAIVMAEGNVFDCGDRITFRFTGSNGNYDTNSGVD